MTSNSEFDTAQSPTNPPEQRRIPADGHGQGSAAAATEPGGRHPVCHRAHTFRQSRRGADLQKRGRYLLHYLDFHGGLDDTVEQLAIDEALLDFLGFAPVFRQQRLAIEAWLTAAYNAGTGLYADPAARARWARRVRTMVPADAGRSGGEDVRRVKAGGTAMTMRVVLERDAAGVRAPGAEGRL